MISPAATRIVAVTSGKGGVGKTSISVNLAVALALQGARVCVVDADTGLANINILLGLAPRYTLEHVFSGEKQLADILLAGPGGVDIIPGASGLAALANPEPVDQQALIQGLGQLEQQYDYLLIDTAAGISASVLHFVASAQSALVVITPEPTSLTDAFSLLKVLYQKGYRRTVQVVVNMVADSRQAWRIFQRFNGAVEKYIGLNIQWLACIPRDEAMRRAIMAQKPVVLTEPGQPVSAGFGTLAELLAQYFKENQVPNAVFSRYWQRVLQRTAQHRAPGARPGQAKPQPEASAPPASPEARWLQLRRELVSLMALPGVTSEQRLQLFRELLEVAGQSLGPLRAELVYDLLRQVEPAELTEDQRQLLEIEGARLGLGRRSVPLLGAPSSSKEVPRIDPVPSAPQSRKHGFDESRFGSQEELLQRLRESSAGEPLAALLASWAQVSPSDPQPLEKGAE